MQHVLRAAHGYTASFILAAMILHVLAVFKHTVINRDGTFDKIMIAARARPIGAGGRREQGGLIAWNS